MPLIFIHMLIASMRQYTYNKCLRGCNPRIFAPMCHKSLGALCHPTPEESMNIMMYTCKMYDVYMESILHQLKSNICFSRLSLHIHLESYTGSRQNNLFIKQWNNVFRFFWCSHCLPLLLCVISIPYHTKALSYRVY